MKANEFKEMKVEDLQKKMVELNEELFNLRFQLHTGQLENTARVSQTRKDIARIKTVLREKQA